MSREWTPRRRQVLQHTLIPSRTRRPTSRTGLYLAYTGMFDRLYLLSRSI